MRGSTRPARCVDVRYLHRVPAVLFMASVAAVCAGQMLAGYRLVDAAVFVAALVVYVSAGALIAAPGRVQFGWFAVRPAAAPKTRARLAVWLGVDIAAGAVGAFAFLSGWQHPLLRAAVIMSGVAVWHLFPLPGTPMGRLTGVRGPQRVVSAAALLTGLVMIAGGWWSGLVVVLGAVVALVKLGGVPGGADCSLRSLGVPVGHAGARVHDAGAGRWWVELGGARHLAVGVDANSDLFDVLNSYPDESWFVGLERGVPAYRMDPVLLEAITLSERSLLHT